MKKQFVKFGTKFIDVDSIQSIEPAVDINENGELNRAVVYINASPYVRLATISLTEYMKAMMEDGKDDGLIFDEEALKDIMVMYIEEELIPHINGVGKLANPITLE